MRSLGHGGCFKGTGFAATSPPPLLAGLPYIARRERRLERVDANAIHIVRSHTHHAAHRARVGRLASSLRGEPPLTGRREASGSAAPLLAVELVLDAVFT